MIHAYLLATSVTDQTSAIIEHYQQFCSRIFLLDATPGCGLLSFSAAFGVTHLPIEGDLEKNASLDMHLRSEIWKSYSREGGQYTSEVADWVIVTSLEEVLLHADLPALLQVYQSQSVTVPLVRGAIADLSVDNPPWSSAWRDTSLDKRVIFDAKFEMICSPQSHANGPAFELMKNALGYKTSVSSELLLLDVSGRRGKGLPLPVTPSDGSFSFDNLGPAPNPQGEALPGRLKSAQLAFLQDLAEGYLAVGNKKTARQLARLVLSAGRNPSARRLLREIKRLPEK